MISTLITNNLPSFVKNEYRRFYEFLTYYFEHLETEGNVLAVLDSFYKDCEVNNETPFLDYLLKEIGFISERDISIPKSQLVLHLRDFYLSKGSRRSFNFFYKLFFDTAIKISYPREKMFVPSWATYSKRVFMFLTNLTTEEESILKYYGTHRFILEGARSKEVCNVESIFKIEKGSKSYLKVQIDSKERKFILNEAIFIKVPELGLAQTEAILPVLDLNINNPGFLFDVGDEIKISRSILPGFIKVSKIEHDGIDAIEIKTKGNNYAVGDSIFAERTLFGHSFSAQVSEIEGDDAVIGPIKRIEIFNRGYNYERIPSIFVVSKTNNGKTEAILEAKDKDKKIGKILSFEVLEPYIGITSGTPVITVSSDKGSGAKFSIVKKTLFEEPSSQKTFEGTFNNKSFLTDSFYYQQFSYELVSDVARNISNDLVSDLLHPLGWLRFDLFQLENELSLPKISADGFVVKVKKVDQGAISIISDDGVGSVNGTGSKEYIDLYISTKENVFVGSIRELDNLKNSNLFNCSASLFNADSIYSINNNSRSSNNMLDAFITTHDS